MNKLFGGELHNFMNDKKPKHEFLVTDKLGRQSFVRFVDDTKLPGPDSSQIEEEIKQ